MSKPQTTLTFVKNSFMPSNSLGVVATQANNPGPRKPMAPAQVAIEVQEKPSAVVSVQRVITRSVNESVTVATSSMVMEFLRTMFFFFVVALGVYGYHYPIDTAKAISNIDPDQQKQDLQNLVTLLMSLLPPGITLPPMDLDFFDKIVIVLNKLSGIQFLLVSGGVPSNTKLGRSLVSIVYTTNIVYMGLLINEDNYTILTQWFSISFLIIGCILPALVVYYETWKAFMA